MQGIIFERLLAQYATLVRDRGGERPTGIGHLVGIGAGRLPQAPPRIAPDPGKRRLPEKAVGCKPRSFRSRLRIRLEPAQLGEILRAGGGYEPVQWSARDCQTCRTSRLLRIFERT